MLVLIQQPGNALQTHTVQLLTMILLQDMQIITRGLYIFNPLFEVPKRFFKEFFLEKNLSLSMYG